jgi:hypothetical protein
MLDHKATEVPTDTAGNKPLAIILNRGIGRRNDHAYLGAMTNIIVEVAVGSLIPIAGSG